MKITRAPAPSEKAMQDAPKTLRRSLMNLKPSAQTNKVVPAKTTDIPIMATQYKTSKNCATLSASLWIFS